MNGDRTVESAPLIGDNATRIPALDGLRALAIILVVACHLIWPRPTGLDAIDQVLVRGWVGVDLFFVLSGFLITGLLLDARGDAGYFRVFYARRALRIFPIYVALLLIYFVFTPFFVWYVGRGASAEYSNVQSHSSWYWVYLVNVLQVVLPNRQWLGTAHLWSLSVEEQFYLVWPVVVLVVPRRRLTTVCLALTGAAVLLRVWLVLGARNPYAAYVLTPARMDALAIGAAVAVLARNPNASAWLRRRHMPLLWITGFCATAFIWRAGETLTSKPMATVGYTASALASAALIVLVLVRQESGRGGWLTHRGLRRVGTLSYGAYLYHSPLIFVFLPVRTRLMAWAAAGQARPIAGHVLWVGSMFALILTVSAVSYRLIEQPFLALRGRAAFRRSRVSAADETSPWVAPESAAG